MSRQRSQLNTSVLTPEQILSNYNAHKSIYVMILTPCIVKIELLDMQIIQLITQSINPLYYQIFLPACHKPKK